MKKSLLVICVLLYCKISSIGQTVYLSETFEGGSPSPGWTQAFAIGSQVWRYRNGGYNPNDPNGLLFPPQGPDIARNPPSAHGGTYNAFFQKESIAGERTKLISPKMNLEAAIKPELTFWLAQVMWPFGGNFYQDKLRIYYRNTTNENDWILLQEYTDEVPVWTEIKVNLPNPSSTYFIAFEGEIGSGFGVCIDDISVVEKGSQNLWIRELKVTHPNLNFVPSGTNNAQILRLDLKVFGNTGQALLNNLTINSLNTSDNDVAPNGIKLYRTATQTFSNEHPIAPPANFSGGVATFSNIGYSLPVGISYLWVTYDVKLNASHGNFLDAYIPALGIFMNDTLYPPQDESPLGNRVIYERIYLEEFEGNDHGWTLSGDFQIAAPQGLGGVNGRPDPSSAFAGLRVLGNDLTGLGASPGDYETNVSFSASNRAISPSCDLTFYKDMKIAFRRYLNVEVWDKSAIDASTDNGLTWQTIWDNNNYFIDPAWSFQYVDIPPMFERKKNFRFRFRLGPTNALDNYSGWNLDNVMLTADFISRDVGVVEWVSPKSGCGLTANEQIKVKVANLGGAPITEPFPVSFSFNGGTNWVTNTFNQVLNVGDTVVFTFTSTVNLLEPGLRPNVLASTELTGDEYSQNDQISTSVYSVPTYTPPFAQNFETNNGFFRPMGTNLWQYGTPNKSVINSASSGAQTWVTHISQNYGNALSASNQTIFADNFEDELGWSFTGEFERNIPYNDEVPYFANSGFFTIGTDISGLGSKPYLYENGITTAAAYRATSPPIDVSNYRNIRLRFQRYLVMTAGDSSKVEVSPNNGGRWYTLWKSNAAINDGWWNLVELPIHDSLTYANQLRVRFSLPYSSASGQTAAGWNIDDVAIIGDFYSSTPSVLEFPCFNLTAVTKPVFEARLWVHTEPDVDGLALYYSIDNGVTWSHVSNITPYNSYWNWYGGKAVSALGADGWSGSTGGWITVKHLLPSQVIGLSGVRLRLVFSADKFNNNFNGAAIDDMKIYEAPHDFGIIGIVSPQSACDLSASQAFTVTLANHGIRPIPAGQQVNVGVRVVREGQVQSFSEIVSLSSPLGVGNSVNINLTNRLNMSASGFYNVAAFTLSEVNPFFYSPVANDTTTSVVEVRKPFVELGPNIYTVTPDTIVFNVTNPNATSYLWQDGSTSPIYNVTSNTTALYWVQLSNAIPCIARDTIRVFKLNVDLGVDSIVSPVTSCELFEETPLTLRIVNFGTDTLLVGRPITFGFEFDGGAPVNVNYNLQQILYPDSSFQYTFSQKFDMRDERSYPIRAWVNTANDVDPLNNGLSKIITVYGYPAFDLTPDYLYITANEYTLDAGPGYEGYYWHNDGSTGQTFTADTLGWVIATVTDANGCSSTDSSFIHLKYRDVLPLQVILPVTACEYTAPVFPSLRVKNNGTDTLFMGVDVVTVAYRLDGGAWVEEVANPTNNVLPNGTFVHTFSQSVNLTAVNNYEFGFSATSNGEMRPLNDEITRSVSVFGVPDVELGGPYFTRATSFVLDAGSGFDEYLWNTQETSQTITVTQSGTYSVTVTNNSICSDTDAAQVTFLRHDYSIANVINPVTGCAQNNLQPVTARYSNVANDTLPIGTTITFGYRLNNNTPVSQNFVTTSKLVPGANLLFTFSQQVDIRQPGSYVLKVWGKNSYDNTVANDTLVRNLQVHPIPVVNLGNDFISYTGSATLDAGPGFSSYLWNTGFTGQVLNVTQTGTYSVTVQNIFGCSASDEIQVVIYQPDMGVTAISSPSSSCTLTSAEPVSVTIRNFGSFAHPISNPIPLQLYVSGDLVATEVLELTVPLTSNNSVNYTFTTPINLGATNTYSVVARTSFTNDSNTGNDSFSKLVENYPKPTVNLGPDTLQVTFPHVLVAGVGGVTYLWSTGSTASNITVYGNSRIWLRVTNSFGCSASDTIYLHDGTGIVEIPGTGTVVSVYPNPANQWLTVDVETPTARKVAIDLISVGGLRYERFETETTGQLSHRFDVSRLPQGLYVVRIADGRGQIAVKVAIVR